MNQQKKPLKDNASTYGFIFYGMALLLWAIYDMVVNDAFNWQLPILLLGLAIYLWTKFIFEQKKAKGNS